MGLSISRPLVLAIALSLLSNVQAFAAQPPKAIDYDIVAQLDSELASDRQVAAEQGNVDAQYGLGMMYLQGRGVEQDTKLAVTWFRKAAEQGNASAQSNLGEMYYSGQGGVQDAKQAVVWWRKAAEQGDVEAQHNLGVMYYKGEGIVQDTKLAVTWFRKAAEQGNATTQSILGEMYYSGKGGVQDAKQAVAWWRKAAEQGDAEAQHNLGVMYYKGEGVVQDTKQAVAWISKAAEQGNLNAQRNLEQIQKEAQKSEQEREVDERGDNLYVKTREGDAILTDEPCWLDSSKKNATLPSQNIFPKVGLYGCWEKKSDGYIYIDWFRSLGADGSSLDIHVTDRIPFPG